jgi:short-subunit dehydrogenase
VLAKEGCQLVLAARSTEGLEQAAGEVRKLGAEPELLKIDLTVPTTITEAARSVLNGGAVDVLINCAGMLSQAPFLDQTDEGLKNEMDTNYFGMLRLTRSLLPAMIERGHGTIVNVSSILGQVGTPTTANYSASKAAVEAFSAALRGEVAQHGVRVVVFVAPHTQTELGRRADFRGVRSATADFVGRELGRAIDSRLDIYCAGKHLSVGRKLAVWAPRFMHRKLSESVRHLLQASSSSGPRLTR